ncbi:RDD family protein [Yonghaparkia sp. Soil809]|uniref:RDD family protein n=1 Tax=Yonghaparkia sp. Soil809 TaxID=1736417 RepID=UPI0006FC9DAA|nr:RDD family protein [Yonghaparkia sp. Soil809]KRF33108.1 hypothetical protein ASG83_03740 [Yonghaparkia sp. Soil809]
MTAIKASTESAESLGLRTAPVGRRVGASAIDGAVMLLAVSPAGAAVVGIALRAVDSGPVALLDLSSTEVILLFVGSALAGALALGQVIAHGLRGRTAGRWMTGIRAVAIDGWRAPGFGRALLRAVVLGAAATLLPIIGPAVLLASPLWDGERRGRGLLDRVAREWAIDSRRGLDPLDKEAMRIARRAIREAPRRRVGDARPLHSGDARASLQVPTDRSSAGVVSAGAGTEWAPPAIIAPSPAHPAPASVAAPLGGIRLRFDDGTSLALVGRVLIGRAPAPEPGESVDELIALTDPSMQLSKTHALFALDGPGAIVVDRDSRNGVRVVGHDGRGELVAPRTPAPLAPGSIVELGGRRITIERTDSA